MGHPGCRKGDGGAYLYRKPLSQLALSAVLKLTDVAQKKKIRKTTVAKAKAKEKSNKTSTGKNRKEMIKAKGKVAARAAA
jgi:hypothetical protein